MHIAGLGRGKTYLPIGKMEVNYEEIYQKIWQLSPRLRDAESYTQLVGATRDLIALYSTQGRLDSYPFEPTRARLLSLPFEDINNLLTGSTCLVTGGLGCVGTSLVNELLRFDVGRIVILDRKEAMPSDQPVQDRLLKVNCDIRNEGLVRNTFNDYCPDFVFHTAAQRDPGLAESHVYETISTNVLGTLNIVRACEQTSSVRQCIFSSTGKASRYFTEEVYAGTKKVCEYIFDTYARGSRAKYAMARFTHILDNSLMNIHLRNAVQTDDFLGIHSPGKYVTAQNVKEAAYLMLNALVYSEHERSNFLLVRHLEWPVESLEMALYYIKESGRSIPVVFIGNPVGYSEKFFRGQLDWSHPEELNLLINVYEHKFRAYNQSGDIIVSHISSATRSVLQKVLRNIAGAKTDAAARESLVDGLRQLVEDALVGVNKADTVNILNWGLQPKFLSIEKSRVSDYGPAIELLLQSLQGTDYYKDAERLVRYED